MKTNAGVAEFMREFFERFPLKSPRFFQCFQLAGIIVILIGFVPEILHWLEITPSMLMSKIIRKVLEACGGIMWLMAKLPVENATRVSFKTDKMPFTAAAKAEELNNVIPEDSIL